MSSSTTATTAARPAAGSASGLDGDLNAELSAVIMTPTVRRSVRRSLFWAVAAAGLVVLGVVMLTVNGAAREPRPYGAAETAPVGSRAVVEVLRDAGVDVVEVDRLSAALEAAAGSGTTLLVADVRGILDETQWPQVLGAAEHLVLVQPSQPALDALGIDVLTAGTFDVDADGVPVEGGIELVAGCPLAAAQRAESIRAGGVGYSTLEGLVCFDGGEPGAGLIRLGADGGAGARTGGDVTVLGAATVLQNGEITRAGNAALALGLLGEHPTLVWYQPSPADASAPSAAELSPEWLNPLAWLAGLTALAAAFWRGRRFGPVVIENLPVTVKTTETMEGRARLYAREGSRLRALDALRVGTLRRLAEGLALGRAAGVDDIVTAVVGITGRDAAGVRALLIDREPATDRELVALSDQLLELERLVARRVGLDDSGDVGSASPAPATEPPGLSPTTTGRMDA